MRYFSLILFFVLSTVARAEVAAPALQISDAWLRALPPGQPTAAVYLTVTNVSAQPQRIAAARSPLAQRVEFHNSQQIDGQWKMTQLPALELAPGRSLTLSPGGVHLMLFGLTQTPREGDKLAVDLQLPNGDWVQAQAEVRGFADDAHHNHHGAHH